MRSWIVQQWQVITGRMQWRHLSMARSRMDCTRRQFKSNAAFGIKAFTVVAD
jgi:hypothetical protein